MSKSLSSAEMLFNIFLNTLIPKDVFEEISTAVVDMEDELVEKLCKESLTFSIPAEKLTLLTLNNALRLLR
jgi:hypothetical protein